MPRGKTFNETVEAVRQALATSRQETLAAASLFADAAATRSLPEATLIEDEESRQQVTLHHLAATEQLMAEMVARLSDAVAEMVPLIDAPPPPKGLRRIIGLAFRRSEGSRTPFLAGQRTIQGHFRELLRRYDILAGLLKTSVEPWREARHAIEAKLADLIDHRAEMVAAVTALGQPGYVAARDVERLISAGEGLVSFCNGRVAALTVLGQRLAFDIEAAFNMRALMGARALPPGPAGEEVGRLPYLSEVLGRLARGRLLLHDIDRRRQVTDQAFARLFFPEVEDAAQPGA